jgi:hypothetical protein
VKGIFVPTAISVRPVTVEFKKSIVADLRASIPEEIAVPGATAKKDIPSDLTMLFDSAAYGVRAPRPQSDTREKTPAEDRITVTRADLERYRELYSNPGVLAELARNLMADAGLDLETDYLEFLETKAAGADMNERTPIAGPRGLVTGNLRARPGPGLPAVDSLADEQRRIARLRARMQEIEAMHSAAKPAPGLSAEVADAIASDETTGCLPPVVYCSRGR